MSIAHGVPPMTRARERLAIAALTGIQMSHILDFMVLMPLGPQMMRLFGITPTQFGLLVAVYTGSAAVASLLAAFVIDRFERKRALLVLYCCFGLTALLSASAQTYGTLLAARAIAGIFGGVLTACVLSITTDITPEGRRGRALGAVMSAFAITSILALPVALWLANHLSWRLAYVVVACMVLVIAVAAVFLLPTLRGHVAVRRERGALGQVRAVLAVPNHLRALALAGLLNFGGFSIVPFISPYLVLNVGVKEDELPMLYFLGGFLSFFTVRIVGRLTDRMNRRRLFFAGAGASIVCMAALTNLPPVPLVLAMAVSLSMFCAFPARYIPAMAVITSAVQPSLRGSFMGLSAFMQHASTGVATLIASLIVARAADGTLEHYNRVGWIAMGATVFAIWLLPRIHAAPQQG